MKVLQFLLLYLLLSVFHLNGQNFIPNGSFEDTVSCPLNQGQINKCTGWVNCGNPNTTPDYYHTCSTVMNPMSNGVYQPPRTGDGYAAFYTRTNSQDYREYFGRALSQPLTVGTQYYLSLYVILGKGYGYGAPTNNIGVQLSTYPLSTANPQHITNNCNFNIGLLVSDTVNWTYANYIFTADSAYSFITIGNFFDDFNTSLNPWHPGVNQGYYAIDDICLSDDPAFCFFWSGLEESNHPALIEVNVSNDVLNVRSEKTGAYDIRLYDLSGREMKQAFFSKEATISTGSFPKGIYCYRVLNSGQPVKSGKFILD